MKNRIGYLIKRFFSKFKLIFWKGEYYTTDMALKRFGKRGTQINTIIDIGASNGMWSKMCMLFYPNAKYFLVEAQDIHEQHLKNFKSKNNNIEYVISAAGDKQGNIYFNNDREFGGQASENPYEKGTSVPMNTIDYWVREYNLKPPFLIKLDTHGFEVPILEGATETMTQTNLLIIETYNFNISDKALTFYEMCSYMQKKGFRVIEIVDLLLRPKDKALWQMDTFFIPDTDKIFKNNSYE
ncbi:hypothetical protein EMA8858_02876 [Emticicia aquatica]|uniref:Methyltransferase FkbM domain-containing protein n=2 Tax=Emticicia aquatica TaxID=1681835 RepID=A0ABN8EYK8_9BACT|nr:hypothetical protein EMA8858_02876 [Emticicia aquatica]